MYPEPHFPQAQGHPMHNQFPHQMPHPAQNMNQMGMPYMPMPPQMNFPMPMPSFFNQNTNQNNQNKLVISNLDDAVTDSMVFGLLSDTCIPTSLRLKKSRTEKKYAEVTYNTARDAENILHEFNLYFWFKKYLKITWYTKQLPPFTNSVVIKQLTDNMGPKKFKDLFTSNGFQVFSILYPTDDDGRTKKYCYILLKNDPDPEHGVDAAVKRFNGYAFQDHADEKIDVQRWNPEHKTVAKNFMLYCKNFSPELVASANSSADGEQVIVDYLRNQVLTGIVNDLNSVVIRVRKSVSKNEYYATLKCDNEETEKSILEHFPLDGDNNQLYFNVLKSQSEMSLEYKSGEMHQKCIYIKSIKDEVNQEQVEQIVKQLVGFEKMTPFKVSNKQIKACQVVFYTKENSQNALKTLKESKEFQALLIDNKKENIHILMPQKKLHEFYKMKSLSTAKGRMIKQYPNPGPIHMPNWRAPRPAPFGPYPSVMAQRPFQTIQAPPRIQKTWRDHMNELKAKLNSGLSDELKTIFETSGLQEMKKKIAANLVELFAAFYEKSDTRDSFVGLTIAHFLGYFDSAEDINLLNSEIGDWEETLNNIKTEALNQRQGEAVAANN